MGNQASVLEELLRALPMLRPQMYFKTSLTALSHAMEDQVLAGSDQPLMIASFQQERFYRQEAHRYRRLSEITDHIYVLSAAGTGFDAHSNGCETIAFDAQDALQHEWHLVVLGHQYSACLICREHQPVDQVELRWRRLAPRESAGVPVLDQTRRFEGIWTLDRAVSQQAADILLKRIVTYRPGLAPKIAAAQAEFFPTPLVTPTKLVDSAPFAQRLVTYVQASQYKLLKAYKAMAAQEQRERLINSITSAIRQSLNPAEIFAIATQELGQVLVICRCLIYRYTEGDETTEIQHEYRQSVVESLQGQAWPLQDNPLVQAVLRTQETLPIEDIQAFADIDLTPLQPLLDRWQIRACLLVPLIYQDRLLGMIELHQCQDDPKPWAENDIKLVEAIATQLSVALIQAEAYANLQDLNRQLEALERTRSNLIAITGHELRTPLSTIRVCLESLVTEPDMPPELKQVMLQSALEDSDRMQKLVQDFLTLSRLESGRIEWNLESLSLQECVALALSSTRAREHNIVCSTIRTDLPEDLPLVRADGEWIVEVLTKLIDNACKFSGPGDHILIQAQTLDNHSIQVSVMDSGRGIEPERLEAVFERFYQEEGALRRSVGGTGLGLAICRQIVEALGGKIWAVSAGKNQGTQIHFTLPIAPGSARPKARKSKRGAKSSKLKIKNASLPGT
jgi:DICT domain-containing protein/signal transduction histidine kinase